MGSCAEEVAKQWIFLGPCFCLARLLGHDDFYVSLKAAVHSTLIKYLDVVPAPSEEEPDRDLSEFAGLLLRICYVTSHDMTDAAKTGAEERRKQDANQFVSFFRPPWCGTMTHVCAGCCCDRMEAVTKGTDLIMKVMLPRMTEPAANRYTKIFPVVLQITLALNFFTVVKRAVLRLLRQNSDGSEDDEEVFQNPDAMVGRPPDSIKHMRKVQA